MSIEFDECTNAFLFVREAQRAGLTLVDFCPCSVLRASGTGGGIIPEPLDHPTASWSGVPVGGERGPWSPPIVPPAPNLHLVLEVSEDYRFS